MSVEALVLLIGAVAFLAGGAMGWCAHVQRHVHTRKLIFQSRSTHQYHLLFQCTACTDLKIVTVDGHEEIPPELFHGREVTRQLQEKARR